MVWDTLDNEREVVITNNGRPSALMIPIDDNNFNDIIATVRQVNAMRTVNRMQRAAVKAGLENMSLDEINAEIALARKERSQNR